MKDLTALALGLVIAGGFIFLIYRFLPLGMAMSITGGCFGVTANFSGTDKVAKIIGTAGSWLMPIGIVVAFIQNGWLIGLLTIPAGFIAYSTGKPRV